MKAVGARRLSITTQLVLMAVIPTFFMAVVTNFYLYQAAREEVLQDVAAQGQLIASSLAQSSPYAIVSGNTQQLERSLARLVTTQRGVQAIQIDDVQGQTILAVGAAGQGAIASAAPVHFEQLSAAVFDDAGPHVSMGTSTNTTDDVTVIGRVLVLMSAEPIFELKRQRLFWATLIIVVAAIGSMTLGLSMALRLRSPLRGFVQALRQIGAGDYNLAFNPHLRGELAAIQDVIRVMAEALQASRQLLEDKVQQRTHELHQALRMANQANQDKGRLINRGNELIEDERRRIALEIHDSFNAAIVTLRLWTGSLTAKPNVDPETANLARKLMSGLDDLYRNARRLIKQMHPEIMDTLGLRAALEEMVRNLDEAHPECRFRLRAADTISTLRDARAITVYRLVQEALSNVVKHAHASQAIVEVSLSSEGVIHLTIEDTGRGFDVDQRQGEGIGLIGMRERVLAAQGQLKIESTSQGTRVLIDLPPIVGTVTDD